MMLISSGASGLHIIIYCMDLARALVFTHTYDIGRTVNDVLFSWVSDFIIDN